ncbi:hypothetical protein [Vulcanisaeta sp. JCM 16161]|uniref:hypothetical protein n=1 Tax=Vulcanisaeta sp. JCM 16161 TaxID=1295372 RepID=UPI000AF4FF83|nr:hypothetical protein [Vulcanisaeta sp. JCM 16161]
MRIRVRLRTREGREEVTIALVNSGFESDTPQILLPMNLARRLELWDKVLVEGRIQLFGTVAGPTRLYILPSSIYVSILEDDYETPPVLSDAVISDVEREVLISDYLTGSLGIIVEDFRNGIWRISGDPNGKARRSYKPQYW